MVQDETPWSVVDCDEPVAHELASELGVPPIIGQLLVNRGVTSIEAARRFLKPSLDHLHDPFLLPDLEPGVARVASAIDKGESICVYGDYDVDGVTSTALLVRTMRALKGNVDYRLPHRKRDGYDIKPAAVDEIAASGASLIITCDCGITALETARRARELGIDLIVTDHHEPGPELPGALAVVNPKRADASYPFVDLAGVGVAFKFAQGLVRKLGFDEESFMARFTDLAAVGTVGDVVPLIDENRAIVKHGLEAIPRSKKIGLQSILRSTKYDGKALNTYFLGYILGPRINAVGRMDDAADALKLLLTTDSSEAGALVARMERFNNERRVEQERILAEALEEVESKDLMSTRVLVLSREGWNSGVIGIVAGKICEAYGKPAILISRDEGAGVGHGSARSTEDFNLLEGLRQCSSLLGRFGGHALAAGLSISLADVEAFEEKINALAAEVIPVEYLAPRIEVECEMDLADVTRELADTLAGMEPFGAGNPEPLFGSRGVCVQSIQRVGDGSHLRLGVQGRGAAPMTCIGFGLGDLADQLAIGGIIDLCYCIRVNSFNGSETVQLVGKGILNS